MWRKSASSFRRCRLRSKVADSLRSQTGLYPPDGLAQSKGGLVYRPAKHGEEAAYEVADNLPDIVPVTQKEMEAIETYLAALVEEWWDLKETGSKS
jgi:hypothetical protein